MALRPLALVRRVKTVLGSLVGVSGSMGWSPWPWIQESQTGAWQQNITVNVQTVLANPTLNACITLIASDIAKLRPMLVEQNSDDVWEEVSSTAFSPVLDTPNHYQDRVDFFQWWMVSKLSQGNTYALKARDGRGVVQALYLLDPYRVEPLVAPDGSVFYRLSYDTLADVPTNGLVVPAREIIHDVCCPLFHPLCGVSPIYAAGQSAMQGLIIRQNSTSFFQNGSRPGGVLLVPGEIPQAKADALKAAWNTQFSGDNTGKIAILTGNMKYEPMAISAQDSKLVEQLHMTDEDIPRVFGMPRYKVGVGPDPTNNNVGALNLQYYTDCLQIHITKLQRKLTKGLGLDNVTGRTLAVEFDLDDLQLMDSMSRIEAGSKAIVGGMSPNEARFRFYDLGPVEGGEMPYLQKQNWPLSMLGSDGGPTAASVPQPPQLPESVTPDASTRELAPDIVKDVAESYGRRVLFGQVSA